MIVNCLAVLVRTPTQSVAACSLLFSLHLQTVCAADLCINAAALLSFISVQVCYCCSLSLYFGLLCFVLYLFYLIIYFSIKNHLAGGVLISDAMVFVYVIW